MTRPGRTPVPHLVQLDDGRLATTNLTPGERVYDEDLVRFDGREVRTWNPNRSKLAAHLLKGGSAYGLADGSRVLYLGAANGTTPSHLSDIAVKGLVVGVEFSVRPFRDLIAVSERRENIVPVLADAMRPERYARFVPAPDVVYQDIAQRNQAQILARNVETTRPDVAYFMIKSRSIDVASPPRKVAEQALREVADATGYQVRELVDLAPFERDHFGAVLTKPGAQVKGFTLAGTAPHEARKGRGRARPRGRKGKR